MEGTDQEDKELGKVSEMDEMKLLTSEEVAEWMQVAPSTLCRWRQTGHGPRVIWLSPSCPRYRRSDVEAWLDGVAA